MPSGAQADIETCWTRGLSLLIITEDPNWLMSRLQLAVTHTLC